MKKQLLFAVSLLMIIYASYGQNGDEIISLPEKTPPSPEAFAITKYGDVPINESTGKMTFNVPIYTYKAGNLSLPISLNYMGNGVKVDAPSTWTGINWTLNAGGVITRTVNHRPDELVNRRIFKEDIDALNLSVGDDDAMTLNLYFTTNDNMWDTQPDIFNFSFLNYSGSFFLDRDYNPTLIKGDMDLKIEIEGMQSTNRAKLAQTKHFIITTPDGVKYHFGLNETQDTELRVLGPNHQAASPLATTSFYLYQIEHPLNGRIFLEYRKTDAHTIAASKSMSQGIYYSGAGVTHPPKTIAIPPAGDIIQNPAFITLESESLNYSQTSTIINRGMFLSRIYSQNTTTEVLFNQSTSANTNNTTINGRFNFNSILKNIEVKNQGTSLLKVALDYIYNTNSLGITQRFFLNRIRINLDKDSNISNLGRKYQEYKFSYKNPSILPDRFSFSQDHLGYYNAKNNATLLPVPENFPYAGFTQLYCDRDSDFETRSTGVLTKITYPTGGFTKIEYEAPLEKEEYSENVNLTTYLNGFDNHVDVLSDAYGGLGLYVNPDGSVENEAGAFKTQTVPINVKVSSETQLALHNGDNLVTLEITDTTDTANPITTTQNVIITTPDANMVNGNYIYHYTTDFNITHGHRYLVKLKLNPNSSFTTKLQAKLHFNYIKGEQLRDGEGIRVKRISDYTQELDAVGVPSTPKNIKRYYYTKVENLSKNPLEYVEVYKTPRYIQESQFLVRNEESPLFCFITSYLGGSIASSPINYDEQNISNYQDVVISYGGDNFENGGIAKVFGKEIFVPVTIEHQPRIFTMRYNNIKKQFAGAGWLSVLHGQLLKEKIIKKENDVLYKVQEKSLYKAYVNDSHLLGYLFDIFADCGDGPMAPYENVTLGNYNLFERRLYSSTTTTKKYIDPYPMVENALGQLPDEANYKKIVTTQTTKYNSAYKGLATEIEVTGDLPDKNILVKNKYLDERNSLVNPRGGSANLSSDELLAYDALENIHNIAQPIQVEKYIKNINSYNKLISTKRTLYQITPEGKVVPKKVQTAKGLDNLDDRILFTKYDVNGNLTEVSFKDGAKVRYAYNNNGQVVTKIENYQTPVSGGEVTQDDISTGTCNRAHRYPNSLVTTYEYDGITQLLVRIISPRCEVTHYEYDAFLRLQYIKDDQGNILQEYNNNYRRH